MQPGEEGCSVVFGEVDIIHIIPRVKEEREEREIKRGRGGGGGGESAEIGGEMRKGGE